MSQTASSIADSGTRAPSAGGYLARSESPLASLLFLLPLIVLYEVGTWRYNSDPASGTEQRIIAFNLLREFFLLFGANGRYLPPLAVVGVLLSWHIARKDPWKCPWGTLGGMGMECFVLGVPLIVLGRAMAHYLPLQTGMGEWKTLIVLSLGAGIYEELVFRFFAFTLLSLLFVDLLKMGKLPAQTSMVIVSAVLFAAYHYLGSEVFQWRSFLFRTGAGIYFGVIFLTRGFGITAGAHAAYDILIVAMRLWRETGV